MFYRQYIKNIFLGSVSKIPNVNRFLKPFSNGSFSTKTIKVRQLAMIVCVSYTTQKLVIPLLVFCLINSRCRRHYHFFDCDWFKILLFSTHSPANSCPGVIKQFVLGKFN